MEIITAFLMGRKAKKKGKSFRYFVVLLFTTLVLLGLSLLGTALVHYQIGCGSIVICS